MRASLSFASVLVLGWSLAGCGGGGGGGNAGNTPDPGTGTGSLTFSVSLTEVDVRRSSNGEALSVDTDGINSGVLQLQE